MILSDYQVILKEENEKCLQAANDRVQVNLQKCVKEGNCIDLYGWRLYPLAQGDTLQDGEVGLKRKFVQLNLENEVLLQEEGNV